MIRVIRPKDEPQALIDKRNEQLDELRKLVRDKAPPEEIQKKITGYQVVRDDLRHAQHLKCCYCEKMEESYSNDVEHYRPKLKADRRPGSNETYGYWWLAFTWTNLLFACSSCNRSEKRTQFPLKKGSIPLRPEQSPSGDEVPLILDPADAKENPVAHIEFVFEVRIVGEPKRWYARGRDGKSSVGEKSIEVYGLNRLHLVEMRGMYIAKNIRDDAKDLERYLDERNTQEALRAFKKALSRMEPTALYAALTYDAYRHYVPESKLQVIGKSWPKPDEVGIPRAVPPVRRAHSS